MWVITFSRFSFARSKLVAIFFSFYSRFGSTMLIMGSASTHFVKQSVVMIIMPLPPLAGGIGPTKSIAHCMNGHELVCGWSSLTGSAGTDLKRWQLLHLCTYSLAS